MVAGTGVGVTEKNVATEGSKAPRPSTWKVTVLLAGTGAVAGGRGLGEGCRRGWISGNYPPCRCRGDSQISKPGA